MRVARQSFGAVFGGFVKRAIYALAFVHQQLRQRAAYAGGSANNHLILHVLKTLVLYFCFTIS
jgi:hypothetical protein